MKPRDLYELPLERFVPERTALAKELRRGGRRDEAEAVAKLRKPSVAAWAVNQLVRTQKRDVGALFKAGDTAQRAQADLLAGRADGPALREALEGERAAVARLLEAARGLLSAEGDELSPAVLERVADTLHAAALEPEARAQVSDGCLQRELRHVGLAGAPASQAKSAGRRKPAATPKAELRKREADARAVLERAAREVQHAHQARDAATEALSDARAMLAEAQRRAREAAAVHRRAERALKSS